MTDRRFRRRLIALTMVSLTALVLPAAPASAHTTLKESDPAANSTVPKLPEVVRLTFSETLRVIPVVTVKDPEGTVVNSSPISPRGNTVLQPVQQAKPGRYTVNWEIVSTDGHKLTGAFAFTVAGSGSTASPTAPAGDAPSPTTPAVGSTSPTNAAVPATGGNATPGENTVNTDDAEGAPWWPWLVAVAVLGAAAAALVLLRRRRGTPPA